MTLVKFTNGQKNNAFKTPYTDIFGSVFNPEIYSSKSLLARMPAVNVEENETHFAIELAAPGLKKDDFKINVEKNQLIVSAEKNKEQSNAKKYNKKEFDYSSFARTFVLPESADHGNIQAEYTNGILLITVAKKEEAKIQKREISVK